MKNLTVHEMIFDYQLLLLACSPTSELNDSKINAISVREKFF